MSGFSVISSGLWFNQESETLMVVIDYGRQLLALNDCLIAVNGSQWQLVTVDNSY